ncbi:hypothetical protein [Pyruvatibacter mobilis]|uniref:hypothetical protein n=1 Tax=Pyruvatibacter mobilis TaxID=1712261 RepID=UPI003BA903B6
MTWMAFASEAIKAGTKAAGGGAPAGPLISRVDSDPVTSVQPVATFTPVFGAFSVGSGAGAGVTSGSGGLVLLALGGMALWLILSK